MSGVHDLGGMSGEEPIDRSERDLMEWERRAAALVDVLCEKRIITSDELRRGIESLGAGQYRELDYYERWSASVELLMVEKGLLTTREIDARADVIAERWG